MLDHFVAVLGGLTALIVAITHLLGVNRLGMLTPDRRPILTPLSHA